MVTVVKEKVTSMMTMVAVTTMVATMVVMMTSVKPGGVETIGRCLRLKVPDPSTLRPCYWLPTLLATLLLLLAH